MKNKSVKAAPAGNASKVSIGVGILLALILLTLLVGVVTRASGPQESNYPLIHSVVKTDEELLFKIAAYDEAAIDRVVSAKFYMTANSSDLNDGVSHSSEISCSTLQSDYMHTLPSPHGFSTSELGPLAHYSWGGGYDIVEATGDQEAACIVITTSDGSVLYKSSYVTPTLRHNALPATYSAAFDGPISFDVSSFSATLDGTKLSLRLSAPNNTLIEDLRYTFGTRTGTVCGADINSYTSDILPASLTASSSAGENSPYTHHQYTIENPATSPDIICLMVAYDRQDGSGVQYGVYSYSSVLTGEDPYQEEVLADTTAPTPSDTQVSPAPTAPAITPLSSSPVLTVHQTSFHDNGMTVVLSKHEDTNLTLENVHYAANVAADVDCHAAAYSTSLNLFLSSFGGNNSDDDGLQFAAYYTNDDSTVAQGSTCIKASYTLPGDGTTPVGSDFFSRL